MRKPKPPRPRLEPLPAGNLKSRSWPRFLRGPDQELLEKLCELSASLHDSSQP